MKTPPTPFQFGLAVAATVLLLSPGQSAQGQNLFVDTANGIITQITPDGVQSQFASGLSIPTALAFDNQGNLYVDDRGYVFKFSPAGAQSTFAILGAAYDYGLALDASGNLYVSGTLPLVYEYSPAGTQIGHIEYQNEVLTMAFDSAGDLFTVNDAGSTIMEWVPGQQVPTTFASGLDEAGGIAFNDAGDLFVAGLGTGDIYEYTPGGAQSTFATGLDEPLGLAFNSAGDLFAADFGNGDITEITPEGTQSTFATGLDHPGRLAFQGQVLPVPEPTSIRLIFIFGAALAFALKHCGRQFRCYAARRGAFRSPMPRRSLAWAGRFL